MYLFFVCYFVKKLDNKAKPPAEPMMVDQQYLYPFIILIITVISIRQNAHIRVDHRQDSYRKCHFFFYICGFAFVKKKITGGAHAWPIHIDSHTAIKKAVYNQHWIQRIFICDVPTGKNCLKPQFPIVLQTRICLIFAEKVTQMDVK